jgi:exopolyphosphatase/guanosine-5'-triphosphate,3'-diphosphate pyrophosphatase
VDVGGGSTEFILTESGVVSDIISTDLGVVRLRERYIRTYPPSPQSLIDLQNWLDNRIELVYNRFNVPRGVRNVAPAENDVRLVGTAGTATSLAAMDMNSEAYNPTEIDGYRVSRDAVGAFIANVSALHQEEILERYPILMKGREDVILPGMMIIAAAMDRFNTDSLIVSDRGLLEGIVEQLRDQS